MRQRKKILVLAYMLSPYKGSEYSVAWNYVSYMSKQNDLVVLFMEMRMNLWETVKTLKNIY